MPYRRFDWHDRIRAVENEYRAARIAIDRLVADVGRDPTLLVDGPTPRTLGIAAGNLEGTYLVRLFSEFESALRSCDRGQHGDPTREVPASILIDQIGGRHGQGISASIRRDAHDVRLVRNSLVHDRTAPTPPMTLIEARARLQRYIYPGSPSPGID